MANNVKFKRLIRKYEYLTEECVDIEEMNGEANRAFKDALMGTEEKEQYAEKGDNTEKDKPEKKQLPSKYKKLFRKIVVKSHPDKIKDDVSEKEKLKLKDIYETTVEAYDLGEPVPMIVCAVKLEIDVTDFEEDVKEIENACKSIEEWIETIQKSSAWYYHYVLKSEKEKEEFIKKFVEVTKGKELGEL